VLNGLIQPFQQPERVLGFFNTYHDGKRVSKRVLTEIADQFQNWLKNRSERWGAPVLKAPDDERRYDFVLPYLKNCEPDRVAVILKARNRPGSWWRLGVKRTTAALIWSSSNAGSISSTSI
jgi:hypothetical protein